MVGKLSNLRQLEISKCDMMEEIIAAEEINGVAVGEGLFPKLEAIIMKDMQNLKSIWHLILASNSLACLKTLKVKNCEKIEKIFPEYMNGAFATLETLKVKDYKLVQEIFQSGDNADDKPQLKYITLLRLPQLKQVWSGYRHSSHCFKSLQIVRVEDCGYLEFLFPFFIAKHLPHLEAVTVQNAEKMRAIVSKREEPFDNPVKFEFHKLTSIVLWNLEDLQGFYAGNHSLSCSSLKELDVWKCRKLKLFKTQGASGQGRLSDENLHFSIQEPLFTLEEVIDNIEELGINNEDASMIVQSQIPRDQFRKLNTLMLFELEDATSLYWFLHNISSLQWLVIYENYFQGIFPDKRPQDENGEIEVKTRLKKLTLHKLYELWHICKEGCQIDPVLEALEYLDVVECSNLKHLVPSSVTFNHLTYLEVQNCKRLIYLITSTTATSLVKLTTLKIRECDSVEQIVVEAGGESIIEIVFKSLQVLELESLPKLTMFCSSICSLKLPILEKLVITQCARMERFSTSDTSTPLLQEILTDDQDKKWFCEGDLNKTVNKMFQYKVAFHGAKHLELSEYPELKELWSSHEQMGIFSNLTNLVVHKCDFLSDVLLPLNLLQALSNLEELKVSECDSLRAVFDLTNMNERGMSAKVTIHLKTLELSRLAELKHIWKINCQEEEDNEGDIQYEQSATFHQKPSLEGKKEEDEFQIQLQLRQSFIAKVVLPNLETVIITEMQNLETVWHPILCLNSMGNFKTLEINKCGKVETICPLYMQAASTSLETLTVTECSSVKEIFQLGIKDEEHTAQLKNITVVQLPQLKQIWSIDPQTSLHFCKLKVVHVEHCDALEYLLPFSIAMDLLHIEQITIKYAVKMKEIVSGKEGPLDCPPKFEFIRMTSLVVWGSPQLQGVFFENHSLECPSLKILDVRCCSKWSMFKKQGTTDEGKVLDSNQQVSTQQSPFPLIEVIRNLEKLALNYEDASVMVKGQFSEEQFCKLKCLILSRFEDKQAIFPCWLLQNVISLEEMVVEHSSFKKVFQHEGQNGIQTRIKKLTLYRLDELVDICKEGFQINPVLEVLEYLWVQHCSKLKHLVPSSASFSHLTYLELHNCNGLLHLISSSTARSLIKLRTMRIGACNSLEQVIQEENKETLNEIEFSGLQVLELECLPRFNIFCSGKCVLKFPLLTELTVVQCPRMKSFSVSNTSAPKLQKILTDKQYEKWCWEGDLNRTVNKILQDKVAFRSAKRLELSEYPELKELWSSHVQQGIFGNLTNLVVHKCDFLSDVLLPLNLLQALSNLEELQVSECDSLRAVFDLTNTNERGISAKVIVHLKTIELSRLPEVKHIWKTNCQEEDVDDEGDIQHEQPATFRQVLFPKLEAIIIKDMQNLKTIWHLILASNSLACLETLKVKNCEKIEKIFPEYMNGAFATLETLKVKDCKSVQEIFQLGDNADDKPQLKYITLLRLPQLKQVWSRDPQSSHCFKSLQVVRVEDCGHLEYLFPVSIAQHLPQLEAVTINNAEKMKEIVSNREEPFDNPVKFEFHQLTSIVLGNLENLQGFYAGNHSLSCSSLKELDVWNCRKLKLFKIQGASGQGRLSDENLHFSIQQPLFTLEEVIDNIEELGINNEDASMIVQSQIPRDQFRKLNFLRLSELEDATSLYWFLHNISSLQWLVIEDNTLHVIFSDKRPQDENGEIEVKTRLKKLTLCELYELRHICKEGCQIDPVLEALEYIDVDECSNLKHLVPSSVTLNHLTYLEVQNCKGLVYLITSTTATSLVKLTTLKIRECDSVEQIVAEAGGESIIEIVFKSLEVLELESLPRLKMFCSSSNCCLKLPMLEELVIRQCERMESFSASDTSTPLLREILTDEQDKKWFCDGDLNSTVNKMFQDKATEESSSINEQSSQTHQKSVSTSRAFSSEEHESESKVDEIVDSGRQEMHKLPIPDSGIETQKICEITETTLDRTSQNTSSFTKVDATVEIQEMHETIEGDFVQDAQNTMSFTIVQDAAIGTGEKNETIQTPFAEAIESKLTHTSVQETALGTQDETIEEPLVQATHQGTLSPGIVQDTDNRNQEMYKTLAKTLVPVTQNVLSSPMVDNIAVQNQEMHGISVERPLVQSTKIALTPLSTTTGGSQDLQLHPSENLLVQITTSIMDHDKENIGNKEMHETIQRPLVQNAGVMLIPASSVQDIATETHVAHESIDKPLVQVKQDAWDINLVHERESHDTDIHLSKNLFNQTSTSMVANHKETVETQETCESKKRFSVHDAQNVLGPTIVYNTGKSDEPEMTLGNNLSCQTTNSVMVARRATIDPAPSQPSKALSSSTTIADVCSSFKELDISVQLLPYLEAGVKRHPQVLNWLNIKRRRVFASSSFSLFAEVTRILRTTRRVDLLEDDRNYIRECCAVLQGVGFDDGWISYVHGRIEKCGDEEDLEWKVEEAEAQLESMKKELASMEESLVLLRDKASRLHGYIYLSTLINALLFTILFFIIIHVY